LRDISEYDLENLGIQHQVQCHLLLSTMLRKGERETMEIKGNAKGKGKRKEKKETKMKGEGWKRTLRCKVVIEKGHKGDEKVRREN